MAHIVLFTLLARAGCAAAAAAASVAGRGACTQAADSCESESYDASNHFHLLQVASSQRNARLERSSSKASMSLAEVHPKASQVRDPMTATALSTTMPLDPGRAIHFTSVDTNGVPLLARVGPPSQQVHNPGKGQEWEGWKSKLKLLLPFLKTLPDHDLVAYADGNDAIWGGCDLADFLHAYERIVNRSGAPVVFGAVVTCSHNPCDKVPEIPEWAYELADGRDLGGGFWDSFAPGCIGSNHSAECSSPVSFKFLNAGFFMGPVHEVVKMVEWSLDKIVGEADDQWVLSYYWVDHPQDVTLDYTGELCINFKPDILSSDLLSVDSERQVVINNAFNRVQCLIHGPGPRSSKEFVNGMAEELVSSEWECAPFQDGLTEELCRDGATLNGYEHWYVSGREMAWSDGEVASPKPCGECLCCRKRV